MKLRLLIAGIATTTVAVAAAPLVAWAAAGPTCTVGPSGDYTIIQDAVNDTNCSTIKVAKGTYAENVTISRSLTIKGAKSGNGVNGRTFAGPNESTVSGVADTPVFTVNAANVTIDGFSITNPSHGIGVVIKTAGNNAVVKNNIVDTIGGVGYPDNTVGVYLETGPDNVKVENNRISHIQSVKSAQGVLIGDSTSNNPSLGARVNGNTISDITSTKGAYGVQANNGASSAPTAMGYTIVKIRNNTIKNLNGGWVHAIGLEGDTPNVVVTHNTISNLVSPGADKVAVWFEDNIFFFTGDVSRNNLNVSSGAFGIAVHPALTALYPSLSVDGTCNYWGAANGPGTVGAGSGSMVGPGVDFSPWLKSANLNGRCSGNNNHDSDNHHWNHDDNSED